MRRITFSLAIVLALSVTAFGQGAPVGSDGLSLGVGAFGGLNYPVIQDDQGSGTVFGARGIVSGLPLVTLEPYFAMAKNGDASYDADGFMVELDGSDITAFGVDAVLGAPGPGPGAGFFGFAGLGFFKQKRDQTEAFQPSESKLGYSGGLGLAFGLTPSISLDVRGKLTIIPTEGGSSDKAVWGLAGINFYFGSK